MITTNFDFDGEKLRLKAPTIEEMREYARENYITGNIRQNQGYIQLCMEQNFLFICKRIEAHFSWVDFYNMMRQREEDEDEVEDDAPMTIRTISWTMVKCVYDEMKDQIAAIADDLGMRDEEYEGYDNFEI